MIRKTVLMALASLIFYGLEAQTFKDVFRRALAEKNMTDAAEILRDWDFEDRNDPELYPAYFNYYTVKSLEKDTLHYDRTYADSALSYISEGINMYPTRFDMRVVKIYLLSKLKEFDKLTDETILLIDYSKKIGNNWKSEDFRLLESPDIVMEGAVQDFQEILFAQEDTTLFDNIRRISEYMIKQYPEYEQSWMNLSMLHIMRKEYDKSLEALKNAEKINPRNAFLLYNLAYIYKIKGDKLKAKKYFEQTIAAVDLKKEPHLKKAAEEELKKL